ncbi:MAG: DUF1569 domain-containing protein [Cyclobacteriaceae bacterium]
MSEQQVLSNTHLYENCIERINNLNAFSEPEWGKMNVTQMLAHCHEVELVMDGKDLKKKPLYFTIFKSSIRSHALDDKPYDQSIKTHPQYKIKKPGSYDEEKRKLITLLEKERSVDGETIHPIFGKLTIEQRHWLSFKHLDHHLNQFGV